MVDILTGKVLGWRHITTGRALRSVRIFTRRNPLSRRTKTTSSTVPVPTRVALAAWAASARGAFEGQLGEFVNIPSVSIDPAHKPDIRRMADAAVAFLDGLGFHTEVIKTGGNPVVVGEYIVARGLPTATIYNHMDVQPADRKKERWATDPFTFTRKGPRYFGRGTTDDKGPAIAAVRGAVQGLNTGARVNLKVIWELEEEIGSPHFEDALRKAGSRLATDVVVVSDTIWIKQGQPSMPAGLRGMQSFLFTLEVGTTDQHSGTTGGLARNPVTELCELAADCVDAETGDCLIDGFHDGVVEPTEAELRDFARSGFSVKQFIKDNRGRRMRTRNRMEAMKLLWAQPTFEVHGLTGGYDGPGVKTVIAPRAELKVSVRLVPGQTPEKMVKLVTAHVRRCNPGVKVVPQHGLAPFSGTTTGPYADAVRHSIEFAFGRKPAFVREGGSIGAVITMQERLRAPVMFLGLSLPSHGYHAPDENFDWGQASGGMIAFARLMHELAAVES